MGVLYALGLIATIVYLCIALFFVATVIRTVGTVPHPIRNGAAAVAILIVPFAFGVAMAAVLAPPLRHLAAWPGGAFVALVLPALACGYLGWSRFGTGCGLYFAAVAPDHRVVALFVAPLLVMSAVGKPLSRLLALVAWIPVVEETEWARAQKSVQTPIGSVTVPLLGGRAVTSTIQRLSWLIAAAPAIAAVGSLARSSGGALPVTVAVLGLATSGSTWWMYWQLRGLPRINMLTGILGITLSEALAWGIALSPVGTLIVWYWSSLGRYHLQFAVPLVILVALISAAGRLRPLQDRVPDAWTPASNRLLAIVTHGGLLILLIVFRPDPVVSPAAAALTGCVIVIRCWVLTQIGTRTLYRGALADLYRGSGDPQGTIGAWVHDAVLRRPTRPDFTLLHELLSEAFATIGDNVFSTSLEAQRIAARRSRSAVGAPSLGDAADRWRKLYESAATTVEQVALTGTPHPRTVRRFTIVRATEADYETMTSDRRGRYEDVLAHTRHATELWEQADVSTHAWSSRLMELEALHRLGRTVEEMSLLDRLQRDGTLNGYQRRNLHLLRAARALERDELAAMREALDAMASTRVQRSARRELRADGRATNSGAGGFRWLWSARLRVRGQEQRHALLRLVLGMQDGEIDRRTVSTAMRAVIRRGPEWYSLLALKQQIRGRNQDAYRSLTHAITLARSQNHSVALQRALHARATFLVAHGALDGAKRDLLASIAEQEDIRAAALDAAARIAVGGTAAQLYEYAVDQVVAAAAAQPATIGAAAAGDPDWALNAYTLTELARSRELVDHLAGTLSPGPDQHLVSRLDRSRNLRRQLELLLQRRDEAEPEDRPAIEDQLRALRHDHAAVWSSPTDEQADLATLRAGTPVSYADVRALLARQSEPSGSVTEEVPPD